MDNTISLDSLPNFLGRFNSLCDSVIRRISIEYTAKRWPDTSLEIEARDEQYHGGSGWSYLLLKLKDVQKMSFCEGRTSYRVLSDGLLILNIDGKWALCLEEMDSCQSLDDISEADCFFVCSSVTWSTEEIENG